MEEEEFARQDGEFGIDYNHDFELRRASMKSSVPPAKVTVKAAWGKHAKQMAIRGKVALELRFCYASSAIKFERTNAQKNKARADGGKVMWEWELSALGRAHIGAAGADGQCDVSLCFHYQPEFTVHRYSLG